MKSISFSHYYSKLDKDEYTTIRRRDVIGGKPGDIVQVSVKGKKIHQAYFVKVEKKMFVELSDKFLREDTDCCSREEARALLDSFYINPITDTEPLYIFYLKKV